MHCLALRIGAKPRDNTPTPRLLAKPCTLVHLLGILFTQAYTSKLVKLASLAGSKVKQDKPNVSSSISDQEVFANTATGGASSSVHIPYHTRYSYTQHCTEHQKLAQNLHADDNVRMSANNTM